MPVGANIKRIRELKKISVADLAAKIDTNVQSIYAWEKGDYEPNKENLESISRALGVPKLALLDDNNTSVDKSSDNNGKPDNEKILQDLIEVNDKYRLVPTIILNEYEILSKNEVKSREKVLEALLEQAREISVTKQVVIDAKNQLISQLEKEIDDLERALKTASSAQKTQ